MTVKRVLIGGVALGVVVVVLVYGMDDRTDWSAETKASVWVAIGTGLLALATFWSVLETLVIIRGEDRRHQQSFIPIVALEATLKLDLGTRRYKILASNRGKGPAFDILVHIEGDCSVDWEHHTEKFEPGAPVGKYVSGQSDDVRFSESLMLKLLADGEKEVAVYSEGLIPPLHEIELKGLEIRKADIKSFTIRRARIDYLDMFGNPYKVVYSDFTRGRFDFIMADALRPQFPWIAAAERLRARSKRRGPV